MPVSFAVTLTAAALAFLAACRAAHSTDLYWQIPEGRSVLHGIMPHAVPYAVGSPPWLDHEWLFEGVAALLYDAHALPVLVVLCALAAGAAPLLAYLAARDMGWHWAPTSFAILAVGASTTVSLAERPQSFVLLIFLLSVWALWRGAPRPLVFVPLAAMWSNVHASGVLAPAICVLFAVAYAVSDRVRDTRVRNCALAAAAAFGGTLLNPHGIGLWAYALTALADANGSHRLIVEWAPIFAPSVLKASIVWLIIVAVVIAGAMIGPRAGLAPALAGITLLALPILHARFILFTAAGAMPVIVRALRPLTASTPAERSLPRAFIALPVVLVLGGIAAALTTPPIAEKSAGAAATLVARDNVRGVIFTKYEDEAFLAAFEALPVRVLIDSHGDPYDARTWADEATLEDAQPAWASTLRRRRIGAVVLPIWHPLAQALATDRRWRLADAVNGEVLYLPRTH